MSSPSEPININFPHRTAFSVPQVVFSFSLILKNIFYDFFPLTHTSLNHELLNLHEFVICLLLILLHNCYIGYIGLIQRFALCASMLSVLEMFPPYVLTRECISTGILVLFSKCVRTMCGRQENILKFLWVVCVLSVCLDDLSIGESRLFNYLL